MTGDQRRRDVLRATGGTVLAGGLAGCAGPDADVPDAVHDFLEGSNNYDGSIADRQGADTATVGVGTDEDGEHGLAFRPAAVRVTAGTTVVWEWGGGTHSVVSTPASNTRFRSERVNLSTHDEPSYTFEQRFERVGVERYVCGPHEGLGMKGAIHVVE